ncbi:unnamed protein product [Soboliphyme baturini]|uniref:Transthyretin-like protein 46 n=1 Tax=Soboliphyme baturini TaxID=241478 RepID=A0A183IB58_9BILA|nr:unnamed protein product [Soboliphyme baturini]
MNGFIVVLSVLCLIVAAGAKEQCLTVRGKVSCKGIKGASNPVLIKLVDRDRGSRSDDLMDEGPASKNGHFQLHGCASDPIGDIDPELHIYHMCKGDGRELRLVIPPTALKAKDYTVDHTIDLNADSKDEKKVKYPVKKCSEVQKSSTGKPPKRSKRQID